MKIVNLKCHSGRTAEEANKYQIPCKPQTGTHNMKNKFIELTVIRNHHQYDNVILKS